MNVEFATEFYRNVAYFMRECAPRDIFGDALKREQYKQDEAVAHFTQEWEAGLKQAVIDAPFCTTDAAAQVLHSTDIARHFEQSHKHKLFTYKEKPFLVQLFELDQEKQNYEVGY